MSLFRSASPAFTFGGGGMLSPTLPSVVVPSVPITSPPVFDGASTPPVMAPPRPATPPVLDDSYYTKLQEFLKAQGILGDNGLVDQDNYFKYTGAFGNVQQEDMPWLVGLKTLLSDRFATKLTGDARDAKREELAQRYYDYLQTASGTPYVDPVFPASGGGGGGSGGTTEGPSFTDPTFTARGNSSPFLDAYLRVREQAKAKGPASSLFAKELGNGNA